MSLVTDEDSCSVAETFNFFFRLIWLVFSAMLSWLYLATQAFATRNWNLSTYTLLNAVKGGAIRICFQPEHNNVGCGHQQLTYQSKIKASWACNIMLDSFYSQIILGPTNASWNVVPSLSARVWTWGITTAREGVSVKCAGEGWRWGVGVGVRACTNKKIASACRRAYK